MVCFRDGETFTSHNVLGSTFCDLYMYSYEKVAFYLR